MNWQTLTNWLKQRPWLLLPALGVIPLMGVPLVGRVMAPLQNATEAPTPIASTSVPPVAAPSLAPVVEATNKPQPSLSPRSIKPTPIASPIKPSAEKSAREVAKRSTHLAAVQPALNLSVDAAIQMRVLIYKAAPGLAISTSTRGGVFDVQSGKLLHELPAQSNYQMQAAGNSIVMGSLRLPAIVWVDPSPTGVTYVGDRGYRGRLLIVSSDSGLWVVNYVNLQQYLYSVVGSEVSPSWPMEALKAQAVAARSYALTYHLKPVKQDLYDLGADEYYQVYKGIESEAATTRQAVNRTSGEFVSYRGGVVESLYAATDDIVMEAFQGRGMSQIGALGLAEQGHSYRQILGAYYTGTGVGRIEMDIE